MRAKKIKDKYVCTTCKKVLAPKEAYCYCDPNNEAITMHAAPYCKDCYIKKYGGK